MADLLNYLEELVKRSGHRCELCAVSDASSPFEVSSSTDRGAHGCVLLCAVCARHVDAPAEADDHHWRCLVESIWSEVPAAQVLTWRLLNSLSEHRWAQDALDGAYLDESIQEWAEESSGADAVKTLDSNGAVLSDGDSVTLIKDLDVKGTSFVAKRGTLVKNIRLTNDPENIEGRVNKIGLVLKTCFLKKAN